MHKIKGVRKGCIYNKVVDIKMNKLDTKHKTSQRPSQAMTRLLPIYIHKT